MGVRVCHSLTHILCTLCLNRGITFYSYFVLFFNLLVDYLSFIFFLDFVSDSFTLGAEAAIFHATITAFRVVQR